MQYEGSKAAEDQLYAEVLPRYQIDYSEGLDRLLETEIGQGGAP